MILAGLVFIITYAFIVTERVHRTVAALCGGMILVLLGVLTQDDAFRAIDFNVIFLLAGMMVLVDITKQTGVFEWLAIRAAQFAGNSAFVLLLTLCTLTAVSSALLDNVTVVVLIAPVTISIARRLDINPLPYLIAQVLASNIGGAATLIGDPPNLLIGSAAGLDFDAFLVNMAPAVLLILVAFFVTARFLFPLQPPNPERVLELRRLRANIELKDRTLLRKCLIVMALVLGAFLLQRVLHWEPATVALSGAVLLMLWTRYDPHLALREIEWSTLFFFVGLFILVEGIVRTGWIDLAARFVLAATAGSVPLTAIAILWLSALLSGIVDNIPYTATMIPLVRELGQAENTPVFWWGLALGADLGGNATLVGASANVVVAALAARHGVKLGFNDFLKYGLIVTVESVLIASLYLWMRYLR